MTTGCLGPSVKEKNKLINMLIGLIIRVVYLIVKKNLTTQLMKQTLQKNSIEL